MKSFVLEGAVRKINNAVPIICAPLGGNLTFRPLKSQLFDQILLTYLYRILKAIIMVILKANYVFVTLK